MSRARRRSGEAFCISIPLARLAIFWPSINIIIYIGPNLWAHKRRTNILIRVENLNSSSYFMQRENKGINQLATDYYSWLYIIHIGQWTFGQFIKLKVKKWNKCTLFNGMNVAPAMGEHHFKAKATFWMHEFVLCWKLAENLFTNTIETAD